MTVEIYEDIQEVAHRAAEDVVMTLSTAIKQNGKASWVLAGGTSPSAAYAELANEYADALDWSKVTVLIGDERCVALDHPNSNWGQISKILFVNKLISHVNKLVPHTQLGAEEGAMHYSELIHRNLIDEKGELHIDLIWLGVGEDGHTLSLFPGRPELFIEKDLVLPVHNSPKPPSDRITLSCSAVTDARKLVIFAVGASKNNALSRVRHDPQALPIGYIANMAAQKGNEVLWLYDKAARF